jgi:DNA-binding beta-propeller fold protein YncE
MKGGTLMKNFLKRFCILVCIVALAAIGSTGFVLAKGKPKYPPRLFHRIATFPVFLNTDVDQETVAEIVATSKDGRLLVYTDSETKNIGFVDIRNPSKPKPAGVVPVDGEPTSVAVLDRFVRKYALAAVNTSLDFVNTSGRLQVIDIKTRQIVRSIELGGQPDSIAVSPDGRYAAIAIENERDEDLGDGRPPQSPPGFVVIVDLWGPPILWKTRIVELVGIPDLFPGDPEPEFVDINDMNIAAVTLQENNHMVLINLRNGKVVKDWPIGSVDLEDIDTVENDLIELKDQKFARKREPDGVAWTSNYTLATADEGDLDGGSRGFTIFSVKGGVLFNSGNSVEHLVTRIGHYPEDRSENKGNEPEGVEFGRYGSDSLLFVGSERSSVVAVYQVQYHWPNPRFLQVLPGGVGPEGLLAIPQRGLFVTANEVDDIDNKIRSTITIYRRKRGEPTYPTVESANRADGLPIPWGALSALAADPKDPFKAYTAYDSFYKKSRIFELDMLEFPATITGEIVLIDGAGETVDLDIEGLAVSTKGGFWVVSEGAGSVDDDSRPVEALNRLFKVADDGTIEKEIQLPQSVNDLQRRFGFEGVAEDDQFVFVAFQREWVGDPDDHVRIGRYDTENDKWEFYYYPLDMPTSPNGGWVGLSEITALGDNGFAVIERDNQAGTDARIKKIYKFSVAGIQPKPQGEVFPVLTKKEVRNLIPDLKSDNGPVMEKVEGLMVTAKGKAFIVTDNDGVDDSSGETQLIKLGSIFK